MNLAEKIRKSLYDFDLIGRDDDETREEEGPEGLRVIETARTTRVMNDAVLAGFRPLIKPVEPSPEIRSKFSVWQHRESGLVQVVCDYRSIPTSSGESDGGEWEPVIDWRDFVPSAFPNPFAAYLVPPDLETGERVWLRDLIEDFVGLRWCQGDACRLESCEAAWNGEDFDILYDPDANVSLVVG